MKKNKQYVVDYERVEDGFWSATIDRRQGVSCVTQGKSLAQARKRIREALALELDDDKAAAKAELVDNFLLPAPVRAAVARGIAARKAVDAAAVKSLEENTMAAKRAVRSKSSVATSRTTAPSRRASAR
jgi:predicted RNase H-like HicB family nuclease